jgi:uncharacterized protein (DUF488 family)
MLYTIGFTQKSAEQFFTLIRESKIDTLIDVRLWNSTQLSGFSKGRDLAYFLREICGCGYTHEMTFAPSKELLDDYKDGKVAWPQYETIYRDLMNRRGAVTYFLRKFDAERQNICLLCAEPTAEKCHRRLIAEMIAVENPKIDIEHLQRKNEGDNTREIE